METTTSWRTRLHRMDGFTVVSALVAVVLAGAEAPDDRPTAGERGTVAVLGDSITHMSEDEIHAALSPPYTVEVNGVSGIDVAGQRIAALQVAQTQPDVVVINLGTNDVGARRDPSDVISELGAMASTFGPTTCVVFVTLTTHVPTEDFEQRAAAVNRWIRSQRYVADWDSVLATTGPPAALTTDTVHPTGEGQSVLAQLLRQQVEACTT